MVKSITIQKELISLASVEVNRPAPDFEMEDYLGNPIRLSDYQGKKNGLLVLNRGFV